MFGPKKPYPASRRMVPGLTQGGGLCVWGGQRCSKVAAGAVTGAAEALLGTRGSMSALSAGDLGDLGDLQLGANDQLFPSSSFLGDFLAQLAQETEDGGTPGPSEAGGDGLHGKRKPRVRPRTERAVQLNRAAQARYRYGSAQEDLPCGLKWARCQVATPHFRVKPGCRERKRTRVQELEHTVGELQQRLQQLQSRAQVRSRLPPPAVNTSGV